MKIVLNRTADGLSRTLRGENLRGGWSCLIRQDGFTTNGVIEISRWNEKER